jgi:hypothetical protein
MQSRYPFSLISFNANVLTAYLTWLTSRLLEIRVRGNLLLRFDTEKPVAKCHANSLSPWYPVADYALVGLGRD